MPSPDADQCRRLGFGGIGGSGGLVLAGGSETLTGDNSYTDAYNRFRRAVGARGIGQHRCRPQGDRSNGSFDIAGTTGGASITSLSGTGSVALGAKS